MKLGQDFNKIEWQLGNLDLLEPNALIGDTFLCILALFIAFKVKKMTNKTPFHKNWFWFFTIFGLSLFIGGLGHLFWNYWGIQGKYFSWYTSIISIFHLEQAMIALYPKQRIRLSLVNWSIWKLLLALIALTIVIFKIDLTNNVSKGLLIPSINTAIGMILTLVVLANYYEQKKIGNFKLFWIGVLVMVPSAFFQFMKINFAPWFDRNDASHILLAITFFLFYWGIKKALSKKAVFA